MQDLVYKTKSKTPKITKNPDYKRELLDLIKTDAFRRDEPTTLSSGIVSDFYIDAKMVTLDPKGAFLTAKVLFDMVKDDDIDSIGGMTIGADPIVAAFAAISFIEGKPIRTFIVRKEPKKHGKQKWIEGPIRLDDKVVVIDDVTTTGSSLIEAIKVIRDHTNCKILKAITLVDRKNGGAEKIREHNVELFPIFTKDEAS
jgi:orotate phosphoribosyltransferase